MTRWLSICVVSALMLAGPALAADDAAPAEPAATQPADTSPADEVLKTEKDKLSYALGLDIGRTLKMRQMDVDPDIMAQAVKDVLADGATLLTQDQARQVYTDWQAKQREVMQKQRDEQGLKNKEEGEKFLAENAKKEGITTTPSGLQYKVITKGEGPIPKEGDKVEAHYAGRLIDGTEFDSSIKRDRPFTFEVKSGRGGVIDGWVEAIKLMPVGSKWEIYVPSELAYKDRGAGQAIGPNAVLIFEIELLGIKESTGTATQPATDKDVVE